MLLTDSDSLEKNYDNKTYAGGLTNIPKMFQTVPCTKSNQSYKFRVNRSTRFSVTLLTDIQNKQTNVQRSKHNLRRSAVGLMTISVQEWKERIIDFVSFSYLRGRRG